MLSLLSSILTILLTCPNNETLLCYSNDPFLTVYISAWLEGREGGKQESIDRSGRRKGGLELTQLTAMCCYTPLICLGSDDGSKFKDMFREMHVVDPVLFEVEDGLTRSQVQKVLEQLGVRSLYPVDIIKHHIIPKFKTWKVKVDISLTFTAWLCHSSLDS